MLCIVNKIHFELGYPDLDESVSVSQSLGLEKNQTGS